MNNDWTWDQMVAHVASVGAIVAGFAGVLPPVATLASIIWFGLCIWETRTVQGLLRRRRERRRLRRLNRTNRIEPHV